MLVKSYPYLPSLDSQPKNAWHVVEKPTVHCLWSGGK